jgi:hypothetical protein
MSSIYFIHLDHDIGRYRHIKILHESLNGILWPGVYSVNQDEYGFRLIQPSKEKSTQCAKQAKINMFNDFLKSDKDYVIVFEDDIMWHKNLVKFLPKLLKKIKQIKNWKIVYLGVSSCIDEYNTDYALEVTKKLDIIKLPIESQVYTGAYGFILQRESVKEVLERCNNIKLYGKPFDITCLGHLQKTYPDDCYITTPQLVLADVTSSNIRNRRKQTKFNTSMNWNMNKYIIPMKIPFIVLVDNNVNTIRRFMFHINCLIPTVKIYFVVICQPSLELQAYLYKCNEKGIVITYLQNSDLKYHIITNGLIKYNNMGVIFISSPYISFRGRLGELFFDNIKTSLCKNSVIDGIKYKVNKCKRCNNKVIKKKTNIYSGFMCIKIESLIIKSFDSSMKFVELDSCLFDTMTCSEISSNNLHNIHKDHINAILRYYKHRDIHKIRIINNTLIDHLTENKFIDLFDRWINWYFYGTIFKIIGKKEEYDYNTRDLYNIITTKSKNSRLFNRPEFNVLKFIKKPIKHGLEFNLDRSFLVNVIGVELTVYIQFMCMKYGKEIDNQKCTILFKN